MENKRNKRNIVKKSVSRLYQSEQEKLDFKKHCEKYGYVSESDFLRIAVKEKMARDIKAGLAKR